MSAVAEIPSGPAQMVPVLLRSNDRVPTFDTGCE